MILIADSGSTKTDWVLLPSKQTFSSNGYNPYFIGTEEIYRDIRLNWPDSVNNLEVTEVHYYGAGCSTQNHREIVELALQKMFRNAAIHVEHDMLGAARSALGNQPGIAAILGTGSNACVYDGHQVIEQRISLGFHLGDEGSGGNISKRFLQALLNEELDEVLTQTFYKKHSLTPEGIISEFYKLNKPNQWVASFFPFVLENKNNPTLASIITSSLEDFFKHQISKFPNTYQVSFIGSVAFLLQDEIKEIAKEAGYQTKDFIQKPIDGLIKYHSKL